MADQERTMKLGLNIVANGAHAAGWRMPDAQADAALDIKLWKRIAQAAEAARIHFMFWADGIAVRSSAKDEDEPQPNWKIPPPAHADLALPMRRTQR